MTDDKFEEIVYLVAHLGDANVVRTRAPDGGLDIVRLDDDDPTVAAWGIQAKLHREQIKWPSCCESLDREVKCWAVRHVTFAYPRDLTVGQHRNFVKHLVGRRPGVTVDWWGASKLTALMTVDDGGRAIAKRFFHAEDPADVVDRATRAGGPLRTLSDVLDRDDAIEGFLRSSDPHFEFRRIRGGDIASAPVAEGTAMRLEFAKGDERMAIDMVAKSATSLEHYGPRGEMHFEDPKRVKALLDALREHGGRATLGDTRVTFERIPAPFDQLLTEIDGEVTVISRREPRPLAVRVGAETDAGVESLDVDLLPAEPEPEWDARLVGQRHGFILELRFVRDHGAKSGQITWTWTLDRAMGSAEERAQVLSLVISLHGAGTFAVEDREGTDERLRIPITRAALPDGLVGLRNVYRNLAAVQAFAGTTFGPPPDAFEADEAIVLAQLATWFEAGSTTGSLKTATLTTGRKASRRSGAREATSRSAICCLSDCSAVRPTLPIA